MPSGFTGDCTFGRSADNLPEFGCARKMAAEVGLADASPRKSHLREDAVSQPWLYSLYSLFQFLLTTLCASEAESGPKRSSDGSSLMRLIEQHDALEQDRHAATAGYGMCCATADTVARPLEGHRVLDRGRRRPRRRPAVPPARLEARRFRRGDGARAAGARRRGRIRGALARGAPRRPHRRARVSAVGGLGQRVRVRAHGRGDLAPDHGRCAAGRAARRRARGPTVR